MSGLSQKLEKSRKDLLDIGLRNNFINTRDSKTKSLRVIEESSTEVLKILVEDNYMMSFDSRGEDSDIEEEFLDLFTPSKTEEIDKSKLTDSILQTNHPPTDLQKRLRSINRLSRLSIEEKGVNTLYLALGFIKWYESEHSDKSRLAPIILVPVELSRKSINSKFKIKYNDDEIGFNISFLEKLKMEFGIKIEIPNEITSSTISQIFDKIENSITLKRWKILKDEIRLGLFSFSKFLMYNDLNEENWDDENKPFNHPLLSKFIGDGFNLDKENNFSNEDFGDSVSYKDTYHVLPADSSQQEVIFSVREGLNTIVQGPPGTGKSQTITNIIVDFLSRGKKVLFVAEKLAALKVVNNRLQSLGLDVLGLEIHSNKSNKKQFLSELSKVMNLTKPTISISVEDQLSKGDSIRNFINNYSESVNSEVEKTGFTPIQCFGEVIKHSKEIGDNIYDLDMNLIKNQNKENFQKYDLLVQEISNQLIKSGSIKSNPYKLIRPTNFQFYEGEIFIKNSEKYYQQLSNISNEVKKELSDLNVSDLSPSLNNLTKLSETINQVNILEKNHDKVDFEVLNKISDEKLNSLIGICEEYDDLLKRYVSSEKQVNNRFWKQDCFEQYQHYLIDSKKWYKFLIGRYRKSKSLIKTYLKSPSSKIKDEFVLDLMKTNVDYSDFLEKIDELNGDLKKFSQSDFSKINSSWTELKSSINWFINYKKKIEENQVFEFGLKLDWVFLKSRILNIDLSNIKSIIGELELFLKDVNIDSEYDVKNESLFEISDLFKSWIDNKESFNDYLQLIKNIDVLKSNGLDWAQEILEEWEHSDKYFTNIFRYYWFKNIARKAFDKRDILNRFIGKNHDEKISDYCNLEDILLQINRYRVLQKHWGNIPKTQFSGGKLGILKKELAKKRKLKPIRKLISECGEVILDLKPLLLMSPMTVAQFIETNSLEFDLVVFDEASQIKPVEAFGSILRAKQVVVVGDSKQLPPTSFFDTSSEDEEEEDFVTSDVESILALSQAKNMDENMLRWHYRSKHESLITVSNREFYNSDLLVFPSSYKDSEDFGLKHFHTEGTFYSPDKGGRVNRDEAKLIVQQVIKHSNERPDKSLGVVAFSQSQAKIIEDYLEQELKINPNPKAEKYIYDNSKDEKFFVKNLENVQGDERDYIFISVGYGFQENGRFSYSFGPINKEGGERRLNVLFSRSKSKCVVFSNFKGDQIDLSRTDSEGVRVLKSYLIFAERGQIEIPTPTGGSADSIFEEQVARVLMENGIDVELQVGSAGFKIDICVKHPTDKGKYVLAIECDGASYHSSKIARDRDKSRQIILESLGWKFYRIWSTDWFLNTERESRELVTYVKSVLNGSHTPKNSIIKNTPSIEISSELVSNESIDNHIPYTKYDTIHNLYFDLHEYYELDKLITEIIKTEQPIHKDVILSRVLEVTNTKKAGRRIQEYFNLKLNRTLNPTNEIKIYEDDGFYFIDSKYNTPSVEGIIRTDRNNLSRRDFNFEYVSSYEIRCVILSLIQSSYGIGSEDLINEIPKVFGFKRVTEKFKDIVNMNLSKLIEIGTVKKENEVLKL